MADDSEHLIPISIFDKPKIESQLALNRYNYLKIILNNECEVSVPIFF
jgi:hypothetical protein